MRPVQRRRQQQRSLLRCSGVCCRLLQRALDGWRGAGVLSFPLHSLALPTSLLFRSARNVRQLHLEAIHCGQSTQRLCRRTLVLNGVRWYLPAAGPAGFRCEGQLSQPIRLSMPTIPCNSASAMLFRRTNFALSCAGSGRPAIKVCVQMAPTCVTAVQDRVAMSR